MGESGESGESVVCVSIEFGSLYMQIGRKLMDAFVICMERMY